MNYKDVATNLVNVAFQRVLCISERETMPRQINVGDFYYLDRLSIFLDDDGDAYGVIYTDAKERVAQMALKHFTSVSNET